MNVGALVMLIPIVAIAGGLTYSIIKSVLQHREKMAGLDGRTDLGKTLADSAERDRRILEKLDSLETRLANVEKALNDIPS